MIPMTDVTSSNLAQIGYDDKAMQMYVRFHGGSLYRYDGVTAAAWHAFITASSLGTHLNKVIKPTYPATLIENASSMPLAAAAMQTVKNIVSLVRTACRRPALF